MNLFDRLHQLAGMIQAAAPVAAEAATEVVGVATAVATALPGTSAAAVASELGAAADTTSQVVGVLTSAPQNAGAPVPDPVPPTQQALPVPPVPTVDPAAVAAVAASDLAAQHNATPQNLHPRLVIVETALQEILPLLASLAKAFGKD